MGDEQKDLTAALQEAGLGTAASRDLLLRGIHKGWVATLPHVPAPFFQLVSDINALDGQQKPLADGQIPIVLYLSNAVVLAEQIGQAGPAAQIRAIRDRIAPLALSAHPTPGGPVHPAPAPVNPDKALYNFLLAAFSVGELQRFVNFEYPRLSARLPAGNPSLADYAGALLGLLQQENLVDARLFSLLEQERPARAAEIRQLAKPLAR